MLGHGRKRQHGGRRGLSSAPPRSGRSGGRSTAAVQCEGNGSNLLFDAESKGEEIKAKFG